MTRPFSLGLLFLACTVLCSATPDGEWRDAHLPIVECKVDLPRDFNPVDPEIIVVYSNTSDRCPVYQPVPVATWEKRGIGPAVRFDGDYPASVDPDFEGSTDFLVEIPPMGMVAQRYRVADKWRIPRVWSRMRIEPISGDAIRNPWYEFDHTGTATTNGLVQERSYGEHLSNTWLVAALRENVRSQIRNYATLRLSSTGVLPARIVKRFAVPNESSAVPIVEVVSNMVCVVRAEGGGTDAVMVTVDVTGSGRSGFRRRAVLAAFGIAGLAVLLWSLLRRRTRREAFGQGS